MEGQGIRTNTWVVYSLTVQQAKWLNHVVMQTTGSSDHSDTAAKTAAGHDNQNGVKSVIKGWGRDPSGAPSSSTPHPAKKFTKRGKERRALSARLPGREKGGAGTGARQGFWRTAASPLSSVSAAKILALDSVALASLVGAMVAVMAGLSLQAEALPVGASLWVFAVSVTLMLALCALCLVPHNLPEKLQAGIGLACLALSLGSFGFGVAEWSARGGVALASFTLVALPGVSLVAALALREHVVTLAAGQIALITGVMLASAPLAGVLIGLLMAALGAALASRLFHKWVADEIEKSDQFQRQLRQCSRASDILADYEETRQGWFWETDRRSNLTYISLPVAELLGRSMDDILGKPLASLFDLREPGPGGERSLTFHLLSRAYFQELPVRAAVEGEVRWWSISGRPIVDEFGNFCGFRGSGTDLTEKKRSQDDASRLARYDALTGLANRFQMQQALEKLLNTPPSAQQGCAVMLLDLDRFKQVNDTMGHPAGDALLAQVAQRLQNCVGKAGIVGRLGGDEFKVIVPGPSELPMLGSLAAEIITSLAKPYVVEQQQVVIGVSVGIAVAVTERCTRDELIRNADLALYAAKDAGRGRYHFYSDELHAEAEEKAELERDLREAISRGQLRLAYQPVVCLEDQTIRGFEALLRWDHHKRGAIPPQRFIAIAEESGLIKQIGEWALRTACYDAAQWPDHITVAVNVSPLQFSHSHLPPVLTNALAQSGIDPARLELEITESVFLNDSDGTDAVFAALKGIGVRLALDDFGTGYSSLGYLKKAPFDKIKIDASFVRGATQAGSRNGAIIQAITHLAHSLGMDTTAEGVETHDELALVMGKGCTHVQGYIYAKPMGKEDVAALLQAGGQAKACGPQSARTPRQTMLRKVALAYDGSLFEGRVRNISVTGAMIEGVWTLAEGEAVTVHLSAVHKVQATVRWCDGIRLGVEFAVPLRKDGFGAMIELRDRAPDGNARSHLRPNLAPDLRARGTG